MSVREVYIVTHGANNRGGFVHDVFDSYEKAKEYVEKRVASNNQDPEKLVWTQGRNYEPCTYDTDTWVSEHNWYQINTHVVK